MAGENWSQKQRKQIHSNYAADSMKENVYKYTQKWACLKSALRVDANITDTKGNCSHWLWVNTGTTSSSSSWWFQSPSPSLLLAPAAAGLSSLDGKLPGISFLTNRGGSGAPLAESNALTPGNISPRLYQGHLARTRVHPPRKFSQVEQMRLPPFCASSLSLCPLLLHWLFSGVKMTQEPSLILPHLVTNGQLCVFIVFFLFILAPFLSSCSICCYHVGLFPINILFQLLIPLFVTRVIHSAPSHSNLMTFR